LRSGGGRWRSNRGVWIALRRPVGHSDAGMIWMEIDNLQAELELWQTSSI
jgi:hypothetical protein